MVDILFIMFLRTVVIGLINNTTMERINKMIEINSRGHLSNMVFAYKVTKHEVYNGNGLKAYKSFKAV